MNLHKCFVGTCLFLAFAANAQTDWIRISATDEMTWDVKPKSLEVTTTKGEIPVALVIGRITNKKTQQIQLYKWYVAIADCERELGKVVSLNVDGSYAFENDFVFSSGSVASAMAETICGAYSYQVKAIQKKGV